MPKPKDKLAFFFSFSQKKSPALLVLSYPLLSFLFLPFQSSLPFLKNNVPPFRLRALSSFLNKRPPFLSRKSLGVACLFSPWFVLTNCYLPLLLVKISDFMPLTAAKSPKNRKRKAQKNETWGSHLHVHGAELACQTHVAETVGPQRCMIASTEEHGQRQ